LIRYILVAFLAAASPAAAQTTRDVPDSVPGMPEAVLIPAPSITFPAEVDSNSPAFWDDGQLHVFNSLHHPYISDGLSVSRLDDPIGVIFRGGVTGPRWMESVIQDEDGALYGYYHFEPRRVCESGTKTAPQIGAVRSRDGGLTWDDLGIIIASTSAERNCDTMNLYFVAGEGDFSAVLDRERQYVYFVYSSYSIYAESQGISLARMAWSDRDNPLGRLRKWRSGSWMAPGVNGRGTPVYPARGSWHLSETDTFWGPSVHWNTYLGMYVILMARASDPAWSNQGIYVAYAPTLDNPYTWSQPRLLVEGGAWYPQVMGLERGSGTDSLAGAYARFFMGGRSDHWIRFQRTADPGGDEPAN
jgi:hypothetical protein